MIDAKYRTSTVIALCQSMREVDDYSACPILADALEDAGLEAENVLAVLRGDHPSWQLQRIVASIFSDQTARAVEWMERFATHVYYNYWQVMLAGKQYLKTDEPYVDPEGDNWVAGNATTWFDLDGIGTDENSRQRDAENKRTCEDYWHNWHLITGQPSDPDKRSPFTCPC